MVAGTGWGYCSEAGRFSSCLTGATPFCDWLYEVFVRNFDFEFAELARGGMLLLAAAV